MQTLSKNLILKISLSGILLSAGIASAKDFYGSPTGSGDKSGQSAGNAAPATSLNSLFNDSMKAGDRLLLSGGVYENVNFEIKSSGGPTSPKIIEGASQGDATIFKSSWSIETADKGPTAISFGTGVSGVSLKNLQIKNYCFAIRAAVSKETPRTHLSFDHITIEQVRHGFYLSDCDDLAISNCHMKRYSKHGFRFDQGCDRVSVKNCSADCSEGDAVWETKTEVFPFGFIVNNSGAPNTVFVFEDCIARNNIKSNQTVKYTNGDGFVVEGNTTDVTFRRCHALRNQDGGFDLKVKDVKLSGCIAIGHRRNFRLWSTGTLENCFSGWSTTGIWSKDGGATATNCTFHGNTQSAAENEDKATAPLTLINCLISSDTASPKFRTSIGNVELKDSIVADPNDPAANPKYAKADPKWDGQGSAMDSAKYPDKGFSAARAAR